MHRACVKGLPFQVTKRVLEEFIKRSGFGVTREQIQIHRAGPATQHHSCIAFIQLANEDAVCAFVRCFHGVWAFGRVLHVERGIPRRRPDSHYKPPAPRVIPPPPRSMNTFPEQASGAPSGPAKVEESKVEIEATSEGQDAHTSAERVDTEQNLEVEVQSNRTCSPATTSATKSPAASERTLLPTEASPRPASRTRTPSETRTRVRPAAPVRAKRGRKRASSSPATCSDTSPALPAWQRRAQRRRCRGQKK